MRRRASSTTSASPVWSRASSRSSSPTRASCSRSRAPATCRARCRSRRAARCPHRADGPGDIGFLLAAITEDGAHADQHRGLRRDRLLRADDARAHRAALARARPRAAVPDAGRHVTSGVALVLALLAVVATFLVDVRAAVITLGVYVAGGGVLRLLLAPPPRRVRARGGVRRDHERRVGVEGLNERQQRAG